jgi:hypothetical protein
MRWDVGFPYARYFLWLDQRIFAVTCSNAERPYVECTACKKRAPTEVEALQDALRIGQEALDKVTALQDSGTDFGS